MLKEYGSYYPQVCDISNNDGSYYPQVCDISNNIFEEEENKKKKQTYTHTRTNNPGNTFVCQEKQTTKTPAAGSNGGNI